MAFYSLTKADTVDCRYDVIHYHEHAIEWFAFVKSDIINGDMYEACASQYNASKCYAIARVKMGLVESDYDWESK